MIKPKLPNTCTQKLSHIWKTVSGEKPAALREDPAGAQSIGEFAGGAEERGVRADEEAGSDGSRRCAGGGLPSSTQLLLIFIHQAKAPQLSLQGALKGIPWFLRVSSHPSVRKLSKLSGFILSTEITFSANCLMMSGLSLDLKFSSVAGMRSRPRPCIRDSKSGPTERRAPVHRDPS